MLMTCAICDTYQLANNGCLSLGLLQFQIDEEVSKKWRKAIFKTTTTVPHKLQKQKSTLPLELARITGPGSPHIISLFM